jgi:hypothetical protein
MPTASEIIKTDIADIWIDSDQVGWMHFKPTDSHGLEDAKKVVNAHNILANGIKIAVVADLRDITTGADREARKYYVQEESAQFKLAMAMLVNSPVQRMLGNLFMRLNKPPYPTRLFKLEKEALTWLKEFPSE